MEMSAKGNSSFNQQLVSIKTGDNETGDNEKSLIVPVKPTGYGSGISRGEFVALTQIENTLRKGTEVKLTLETF